jgi:hypothetical protein
MSRLAARIGRLEQRLGGCPVCASRPALIELVTPSGRSIPGGDADSGPCPGCGQPREVLQLRLQFDPHLPSNTGSGAEGQA